VSDTGASFGSLLEARSRIRVGDKKVIIPVNYSQQKLLRGRKKGGVKKVSLK
jgi:hypothetical protein